MASENNIDYRLLAIARTRLEDSPGVLTEFVRAFEPDNEQGRELRNFYNRLRAMHETDILDLDGEKLKHASIDLVDTFKKVYCALQELEKSERIKPAALEFLLPEKLVELAGRSIAEIYKDVCHGRLTASVSIAPVEAEDHITRERPEIIEDNPFFCMDTRDRIVWLTVAEANDLVRNHSVIIKEADYPVFIDATKGGELKRYKRERVIFREPYRATLNDLVFLDGDADQYISRYANRPLPEKPKAELPNRRRGGSDIVYSMLPTITTKGGSVKNAETLQVPATWYLRKLKRAHSYNIALYNYLKAQRDLGRPIPAAGEVLRAWRLSPPPGISVASNLRTFEYPSEGKQPIKISPSSAMAKAIKRMTTPAKIDR